MEVKLRSGEAIEGLLSRVDEDSLQIMREMEIDFPITHETEVPFCYPVGDIMYVDMLSGTTPLTTIAQGLGQTVLGSAAMAFLLMEAIGKEEDESWPSDLQIAAGGVAVVVGIVGGLIMTATAVEINPLARYWMDVPEHRESLKIMASTAEGVLPHRLHDTPTIIERAEITCDYMTLHLTDGRDIRAYLYDFDLRGIFIITNDSGYRDAHEGRRIGLVAWRAISSISSSHDDWLWQRKADDVSLLREWTFVRK